ncbi:MAG: FtsX-like permease family protein [Methanobacteriota archaeon]
MRPDALFGYALTNVVRARRRSATVLVGLTLAVAIVATPVVALDSQVRALVDRLIAPIPFDVHAVGRTNASDAAASAVEALDGVVGAEPVVLATLRGLLAGVTVPNASVHAKGALGFAFVRPTFARFSERLDVSGDFGVAPGEVGITDRLAAETGLGVGDTILFWSLQELCDGRPPVCVVVNVTKAYPIGSVLETPLASTGVETFWLPTGSSPLNATVFAPPASLDAMKADLLLSVDTPPLVTLVVWADRTRLIDAYNVDVTQARVLGLRRTIEEAVYPWGLSVRDAFDPATGTTFVSAVETVNDETLFQTGLLVLFSMPATALALVFTRIAFDIGLARRRREIGILRSRGWSARQVLGLLVAEAVVLGALGAGIGMAVAIVGSRALLGLASASLAGGLDASAVDVTVSPLAVVVAVVAAIGAALLVAVPVVRRAASTRIVWALAQIHAIETRVTYGAASSVAVIVLGLLGIALAPGFEMPSQSAGFVPFLAGALRVVGIVAGPIFLVLGVARIVTLGTDRPYRATARLVRPWARDMDFLVAEGLKRNPRRSSNLVVVAAFGLGFAMFVVSLLGSVSASEVRSARGAVGGDLFFETASATRADLTGLRTTPGVADVAVAEFLPSNYGVLVAIDLANYTRVAPGGDPYYVLDGPPSAVASLPGSGAAVVNDVAARHFRLRVGDPLAVVILSGRFFDSFQTRVAAVVRDLPGLQPNGEATDPRDRVVVDVAVLESNGVVGYPLVAPNRRAIVRTEAAADPRDVARSLEAAWPGRAVLFDDVLAALRADPFRASLIGHLYTQAGLAVAVLIVAVGLTVFLTGIERDGEFATIAARGLDGRGVAALLFGEGLVVAALGAVLAVPAAFVSLAVFLGLYNVGARASLALELTVPATAWLLLAGAFGATLGGAFLAAARLRRIDLPRILKLRGL